jgi:hypothetical protein
MRTTRLRAGSDLVYRVLSVTSEVARETRALRRGVKRMPKPMPWDWAAPRMLPILSGPSFDPPGEPLIRFRSELGPMVQFGVDLGGAFVYVDEPVARRWECTAEQLMERALRNLGDRASRVQPTQVAFGVMSGRSIRILRDRPRWASSLVLVPDELFRLFGDHDQIIGTPTQSCLVSLPLDTPPHTVAEILIDFERGTLRSLWLDQFVVEDRRLIWSDDAEADEDDDRW